MIQMIPVMIIVTFLVYALMLAIPGDPARALIGPGESLDEEQLEYIRKKHNLDKPVLVQYGIWLSKAVQGDLGRSTQNQRPIAEELRSRAAVTFQFGLIAWVLAIIIGIPLGVTSAVYRGKPLDFIATIISIGGVAIPNFWLGIMCILYFGVVLGWLPAQGYVDIFENPKEGLRHMILPAFALGITSWALIMRQCRSAMLEVLAQDYVRTAKAKGLLKTKVVWVHALRSSPFLVYRPAVYLPDQSS
jgi:peptide/nickel transport system permease protein